jgi:hypothetical protein
MITEHTATRLVIKAKNSSWGFLFAAICVWLGLTAILRVAAITFTCHRIEPRQGQCELAIAGLTTSARQLIDLTQVIEARVEASVTTDARGRESTDYQVVLRTRSGSVDILSSSDFSRQYDIADRINAFITDTNQEDLSIEQDERLISYTFGSALVAFGVWMVLLIVQVTIYTFDRTANTLAIERRLFGVRVNEYPLNDIEDVYALENERSRSRPKTRTVYIHLKSNRRIPMAVPDDDNLINTIRAFLVRSRIPA